MRHFHIGDRVRCGACGHDDGEVYLVAGRSMDETIIAMEVVHTGRTTLVMAPDLMLPGRTVEVRPSWCNLTAEQIARTEKL